MSATSTYRTQARSPDDDRLQVLAERLRRRGWPARVMRYTVGEDLDVRLTVGVEGPLAVEVLGAWGDTACRDRWQAVRITDDGRAVWSGPPRACTEEALVTFVEELLRRDEAQLAGHYRLLG